MGRSKSLAHTKRAPSASSCITLRGAALARAGSGTWINNKSAAADNMLAKTNAALAPAQDTKAPARAGPAAKATLRANSRRPLAAAKDSRGTSAGTRAGAATVKPTVPVAPIKPSSASMPRLA